MGLKAKEIEPNAAEMAAATEIFELVTECFKTRWGGFGNVKLARIIARHTRPRWTDERPTAEDEGLVAAYERPEGGVIHGLIVRDEEGVLWLHTVGRRSLWIADLRGRWCVYAKPMEVSDGD